MESLTLRQKALTIRDTNVDMLKWLYYDLKDKMIPETELLDQDITEVFWVSLFDKLENGEILVINTTGEVTVGKSTVAAVIRKEVNDYIINRGWNKHIDMRHTFYMDETEFINGITAVTAIKEQHEKIMVQVDDRNSMGDGYLNATTDKQLFDTFSDMFAQQNISRIYCSPGENPDKNALIWLEVIGKNKEEKTTTCKLIYNNVMERQQVTLGRVTFDVSTTIDTEWYKTERKRKFERHDLVYKHGIRDIRDLIFAPIVLQAHDNLWKMSKMGKLNKDIIVSIVEDVARSHKRFLSQLTLANVVTRVSALSNLVTEIETTKRKITKEKNKDERDEELISGQQEKLKDLMDIFARRMDEEHKLKNLYQNYKQI